MDDPVAVTLERRAQPALLLLVGGAPTRLVGAYGERREPALLLLADASLELIGHASSDVRHVLP
jgi:hypothetical protein